MIDPTQFYQIRVDGTKLLSFDHTGEYAVDTNEGGYGAPNEDRNQYAVVLYPLYIWAEKPPEQVGVSSFLYGDGHIGLDYSAGHTNTHISSFEVNVPRDGVYDLNMVLVPITSSDVEGNIRYNTSNLLLEIYTSGSWVELTDFNKLLDPVLLKQSNCSEIVLNRSRRGQARFWELYLTYINTGKNEEYIFKSKHDLVRGQLVGAFYNHRGGKKTMAQEQVEGLDNMLKVL